MRTLNLGTRLQDGRDPAASPRAITPTADLPWRT